MNIKIKYTPTEESGGKSEDEKLIMNINDGKPMTLRCSG
jgi:hypothetical protein